MQQPGVGGRAEPEVSLLARLLAATERAALELRQGRAALRLVEGV